MYFVYPERKVLRSKVFIVHDCPDHESCDISAEEKNLQVYLYEYAVPIMAQGSVCLMISYIDFLIYIFVQN